MTELDPFRLAADLLAPPQATLPGERYATPGALAKALDATTVQTPALDLIDQGLVDVDRAVAAMLARRRVFARHWADGLGEDEAREQAAAEVPQAGTDRLILSMPPQEGKSERTSHYGLLWLLSRHPGLRVGIVSYAVDIARRFSYQIRNDIATFTGDDGGVDLGLRLRQDSTAAARWQLAAPHGGSLYAVGIGGALTSRPIDLLVIDDPVKDYRAADSQLQSERAWQWWQSVARPRLAPGAPVIVILTRWHESDLAGRLLAKQAEDEKSTHVSFDRWRTINISAQADYDPEAGQTDPLGRQPGEFMASARGRTQAQWEATKAATQPRIWSALYQGRPTPDTGDVLQRHWWRRFDTPIWSQTPDGAFRALQVNEVIQSWDMAFKDTKGSDFVCGQVWARRGAEAFLLDEVHARLSFTDTVAAVRLLTRKWPQAYAKLVEDKANGTAVIDSLKKEIGGIIPITPHESKFARAAAVSPFVEAGNVHLPEQTIALYDVAEVIEEAAVFPNGQHDDRVDALSQALGRFFLRPGQGQAFMEAWAPEVAQARAAAGKPPAPRGLPSMGGAEPDAPPACECRNQRFFDGRCVNCGGIIPPNGG